MMVLSTKFIKHKQLKIVDQGYTSLHSYRCYWHYKLM